MAIEIAPVVKDKAEAFTAWQPTAVEPRVAQPDRTTRHGIGGRFVEKRAKKKKTRERARLKGCRCPWG